MCMQQAPATVFNCCLCFCITLQQPVATLLSQEAYVSMSPQRGQPPVWLDLYRHTVFSYLYHHIVSTVCKCIKSVTYKALIYNSHYVTSEKSGLKPWILLSTSYSPKKYEIFVSPMLSMTHLDNFFFYRNSKIKLG